MAPNNIDGPPYRSTTDDGVGKSSKQEKRKDALMGEQDAALNDYLINKSVAEDTSTFETVSSQRETEANLRQSTKKPMLGDMFGEILRSAETVSPRARDVSKAQTEDTTPISESVLHPVDKKAQRQLGKDVGFGVLRALKKNAEDMPRRPMVGEQQNRSIDGIVIPPASERKINKQSILYGRGKVKEIQARIDAEARAVTGKQVSEARAQSPLTDTETQAIAQNLETSVHAFLAAKREAERELAPDEGSVGVDPTTGNIASKEESSDVSNDTSSVVESTIPGITEDFQRTWDTLMNPESVAPLESGVVTTEDGTPPAVTTHPIADHQKEWEAFTSGPTVFPENNLPKDSTGEVENNTPAPTNREMGEELAQESVSTNETDVNEQPSDNPLPTSGAPVALGVRPERTPSHPKNEAEQQKSRLEAIPDTLKDAAFAYAQARKEAEARIIEESGWFKKIARKQGFGFDDDTEARIADDPTFKAAEEALFAARESVEQRLDERLQDRISERKAALADDTAVRETLARTQAGKVSGETVTDVERAAVSVEDITAYRTAYLEKLQIKAEKIKHVLRYEHINAPLRELSLRAEQEKYEHDTPTAWHNVLNKSLSWWRGDRSTFAARQKMIVRNAGITTVALAGLVSTLPLSAGAGFVVLGRFPVKVFSALVGANVGALAAKGTGTVVERVLVREKEQNLSNARSSAKEGTQEGRNRSLKDVFNAEETYQRGQKKKAIYQGAIGALAGAGAGIGTNMGLSTVTTEEIATGVDTATKQAQAMVDTVAQKVQTPLEAVKVGTKMVKETAIGGPALFVPEQGPQNIVDFQQLVEESLKHPGSETSASVTTDVAERLQENTQPLSDTAESATIVPVGEAVSVVPETPPIDTGVLHEAVVVQPDVIETEMSTAIDDVPHEPTPTMKFHLEGTYGAGESVEKVLINRLQETHPGLEVDEAGAVAHRIATDLRDNAEAAKGFGVDHGAWDQVGKGEAYNVSFDQSLVDKHILGVQNKELWDTPETTTAPEVAAPMETPAAQEAPVPVAEVTAVSTGVRPNAFMTREVVLDLDRAQRSLDWLGQQTRPALDQLLKSDLLDKKWVAANQLALRSNWGVIDKVPVSKIFDRTPGIEYLTDDTTIKLLPDTEAYLRTFMNRIDTLPNTNALMNLAQQKQWTVGQLVKAIMDRDVPSRSTVSVSSVPAAIVQEPPTSVDLVSEQVVQQVPQSSTNTWIPRPIRPGVPLRPGPPLQQGYQGRMSGGYEYVGMRPGPQTVVEAGGVVRSGPLMAGGEVRAEYASAYNTEYHIPSVVHPGMLDPRLEMKFQFDIAEATQIFSQHPQWAGKTFGDLAHDPAFQEVWNREVFSVQAHVSSQAGGIPKRLLYVDPPSPDTPAQEALTQLKHVETQLKFRPRYVPRIAWPPAFRSF